MFKKTLDHNRHSHYRDTRSDRKEAENLLEDKMIRNSP